MTRRQIGEGDWRGARLGPSLVAGGQPSGGPGRVGSRGVGMSTGSFTFRCTECNRLLGVSRSRVGQSITCPKCGTEQPVPNPDLFGDSGGPSGMVLPPPTPPATAPSPSVSDPGVPSPVPTPTTTGAAEPAFAGLLLDPEPLSIRPTEPARARSSRRAETTPQSTDTAATKTATTTPGAPNDLVLPREVVRFWSLASLLGTISAFVAGLLVGHFLWR